MTPPLADVSFRGSWPAAVVFLLAAGAVLYVGVLYARERSLSPARRAFLAGLRDYFGRYAWGNATFEDLLRSLETASGTQLRAFASDWLETAQVNVLRPEVTIDASGIRPLTLVGPGAGGAATASAVLTDIGDIARGVRTAPFGRPTARLQIVRKAPMQRHEGGYYIRLVARDRPGTAAAIATRLAEQGISLESIVQRHDATHLGHDSKAGSVPVILITYATSEDAVRKALAAVGRDRVISGRPQVIRIEKN